MANRMTAEQIHERIQEIIHKKEDVLKPYSDLPFTQLVWTDGEYEVEIVIDEKNKTTFWVIKDNARTVFNVYRTGNELKYEAGFVIKQEVIDLIFKVYEYLEKDNV